LSPPKANQRLAKKQMFIENRIKRKESINEQIIEKNVIIEIMQVFP